MQGLALTQSAGEFFQPRVSAHPPLPRASCAVCPELGTTSDVPQALVQVAMVHVTVAYRMATLRGVNAIGTHRHSRAEVGLVHLA